MTTKSGWCLVGECVGAGRTNVCPGTFSYGDCPCTCHTHPVITALAEALNDRVDLAALVIITKHKEITDA